MPENQIDAEEEYIHKLYGEDYLYQIPKFQRPFSWTEENFVDLLDDLIDAYEINAKRHGELLNDRANFNDGQIDRFEPYFLGSIILNGGQGTGERSDIIDGQQRLTSIAILIAVLRDHVEDESWSTSLRGFIHEEGDVARAQAETVRLKIRDRDLEFFKENVLQLDATTEDIDPVEQDTEARQNIIQAVSTFKNRLAEWLEGERNLAELAAFLTQRVVMVRIKTTSLSSAFRLFNVTNARGMPLNNADLLKSENLSHIDEEERNEYLRKWEDMEEEVGNEGLERFIGLVRHLTVRDQSRKSIYDEFKDNVFANKPEFRGKNFIDYLQRVFDTHRDRVHNAQLRSDDEIKNTYYHNLVSLMRDFYPSDEWIVALILFDDEFEGETLFQFVIKLERRLTVDWLTGASNKDRYTRTYGLLREIEAAQNPNEIIELDLLNDDILSKREDLSESLDLPNFYRKGSYQWPRYILMRLNMERYDNRNVRIDYGENITVEHILPQTPASGYWTEHFDDEMYIERWTDKLGNLALLDGRKNYKAKNYPFPKKYEEYFAKKSDFEITNELSDIDHWTPEKLEERHESLKLEAIELWINSA